VQRGPRAVLGVLPPARCPPNPSSRHHPLAAHHATGDFDCGDVSLNHWLQRRSLSNQRSGATRTFGVASTPGRFRRNMPDPIPVIVLARLAVCRTVQGQGVGRALLADAFERVLQASQQIGVRGIVVHAASASAREFYLHLGFEPSPLDANTLVVRLSDVAASLTSPL